HRVAPQGDDRQEKERCRDATEFDYSRNQEELRQGGYQTDSKKKVPKKVPIEARDEVLHFLLGDSLHGRGRRFEGHSLAVSATATRLASSVTFCPKRNSPVVLTQFEPTIKAAMRIR